MATTTITFFGTVELAVPGSPKPWVARYENGVTGGFYGQQGEARAQVQSHAGLGCPLTWTEETQDGCPEQWRGEFIVTV